MDFLRSSVTPPDDATTLRGVYIYACNYGAMPGMQQFFHTPAADVSDTDHVPVYMSTNVTGNDANQDWEVEWGSLCGYEPRPSQREHAKRHLFKRVDGLTFSLGKRGASR
jgi:hypothetical protein